MYVNRQLLTFSATHALVATTNQLLVFSHTRDKYGNIIESHTLPRITCTIVPSLGKLLDSFVDAFGYDEEFIYGVYNGLLKSATSVDLAAHCSFLSVGQVQWIWAHWDVKNQPMSTRCRNYNQDITDLPPLGRRK